VHLIELPADHLLPHRPGIPIVQNIAPTDGKEPAMDAPTVDPAVDIRLMVTVTEFLQEYFDKTSGRYLNDWSDGRVAEKTGAAEAFVTKVRRAAFGELAEDPELTEIRRLIDKLAAEVEMAKAAIDKDLDIIRQRFTSYVQSKRGSK
jgi:hypothetical protein